MDSYVWQMISLDANKNRDRDGRCGRLDEAVAVCEALAGEVLVWASVAPRILHAVSKTAHASFVIEHIVDRDWA